MNVLTLTSFLAPVVAEACAALQLQERGSDELAVYDARVDYCARFSYGMIASYCNREFCKDTFIENYFEQDTKIRLRNIPVVSVAHVYFIDHEMSNVLTDSELQVELVATTDYNIKASKDIVITNSALEVKLRQLLLQKELTNRWSNYTLGGAKLTLSIEYVGGYATSDENQSLHTALTMQTIASYNRLPSIGIASLRGEMTSRGGTGHINLATGPDSGNLLDAVVTLLSPFIYYGPAESV